MSEIKETEKSITAKDKLTNILNDFFKVPCKPKANNDCIDSTEPICSDMQDNNIIKDGSGISSPTNNFTKEEIKLALSIDTNQKVKYYRNFNNIVNCAYKEIEVENKEVCNDDVDEDWLNNFYEKTKVIQKEDLQFLFGKILAGEIMHPGTYSKRLVNILSELSQEEAMIFKKISNLVLTNITSWFIISDENILKNFNIYYGEIVKMEDVGLMNSSYVSFRCEKCIEYINTLVSFDTPVLKLNTFVLTEAGKELLTLLNPHISIKYLLMIKNKYKINKLSYCKISDKIKIKGKTYYVTDKTKISLNGNQ